MHSVYNEAISVEGLTILTRSSQSLGKVKEFYYIIDQAVMFLQGAGQKKPDLVPCTPQRSVDGNSSRFCLYLICSCVHVYWSVYSN